MEEDVSENNSIVIGDMSNKSNLYVNEGKFNVIPTIITVAVDFEKIDEMDSRGEVLLELLYQIYKVSGLYVTMSVDSFNKLPKSVRTLLKEP
jgi:ABC-type transporter Mla MlaB component